MRTEDDLREAIDSLAAGAPAPEAVLARLSRASARSGSRPASRGPNRRLILVAAIAVLIAAVVAVPLIVRSQTVAPAERRVAGYWKMISVVDPPTGWSVVARGIGQSEEYTELAADIGSAVQVDRQPTCTVTVYGRAASVGGPPPGQPVRIGERDGTYSPFSGPEPALLTWSYADHAVAQVSCSSDQPASFMVALASDTRIDRGAELFSPFRVTDLPSGYDVDQVRVTEEKGRPTTAVLLRSNDGRPSIGIANVSSMPDPVTTGAPESEVTTVNGWDTVIRQSDRALTMRIGSGFLRVSSSASEPQVWQPGEKERLLLVARGLRPADVADPASWYPLQVALR